MAPDNEVKLLLISDKFSHFPSNVHCGTYYYPLTEAILIVGCNNVYFHEMVLKISQVCIMLSLVDGIHKVSQKVFP